MNVLAARYVDVNGVKHFATLDADEIELRNRGQLRAAYFSAFQRTGAIAPDVTFDEWAYEVASDRLWVQNIAPNNRAERRSGAKRRRSRRR